ncbi:hypothetical protein NECAME_10894 [Necator americanus]|uniref:DUF4440 domain-containing protein n=1 Tax=Necator americanus TaxID=51031 RepID=W2T8W6_NECAM|nr:hypothetical protein NECAME_10894 [Necator americanus]ETN77646.1 hypothetical protein NECAME_10894 [Necator americanus]
MSSSAEARSILRPIVDDFFKTMEERDIDKLFAFYDPDAAFVEIGKGGTCGKAIKQDLIKWDELQGKTTYKLVGDKYEMAGDFIIIITGLEVKSEKLGDKKVHFTQIWRKSNDKYLCMHDEFTFL